MTPSSRLLHALSLSLATGLALGGCDPATPSGGTDTDPDSDSNINVLVGVTPAELDTICAADSPLAHVVLDQPADYLALRRVDTFTGDPSTAETLFETGTACATASDVEACETALADAVPEPSGWGYCGEGCSDSGLVTTRGDDVALADSTAEVLAMFGEIDNAADALFLAVTQEYDPDCETVVETDEGNWRMRATIMISDCEWVDEVRDIEVARDGTTTVLQTVEVIETGACAGRRPDGICLRTEGYSDAVADHLAQLSWLEGAAVIAFERLALDLSEHGAPAALVARARAAAADEVDHAARMGQIAMRHGVEVRAVQVSERQERSLFDIALENAVEGCVRETFGVVDAAYRAERAPTAELRELFARIADDEARHAALSWDIHHWIVQQLSDAERAQVELAARQAQEELVRQLQQARPDAVEAELGAPSSAVAVAMAQSLARSLTA